MEDERSSLLGKQRTTLDYDAISDKEEFLRQQRNQGASQHRDLGSVQQRESTLSVFCIHGNKWGVAQCCLDLENQSHHPGESSSHVSWKSEEDLHCHQTREGGIDKKAQRKLVLASVLCILFMIGEVVGGFMANSLAIATDAAHLLTDFASFMISLFAIWISAKPNSHRMSFGWHRAEVLGATLSVLMIWVVTGILVYMAFDRVINPEFEMNPLVMLITSGVGVAFNILMGCTLHQHGHSHGGGGGGHGHSHGGGGGGHGHSHGGGQTHDSEAGNCHEDEIEEENLNVRAAFIHVVGDFLQSVGVFIAALIIYFNPTWTIIDPICTFVFSLLVLATTVKILKDTLNVLMEGTPQGIYYDRVQAMFLSVEGIQKVHSLRIWALTTSKTALSAHLVIAPGFSSQTVLQNATTVIRSKYKIYEMTLQVEEFQNKMEECNQCTDPKQ